MSKKKWKRMCKAATGEVADMEVALKATQKRLGGVSKMLEEFYEMFEPALRVSGMTDCELVQNIGNWVHARRVDRDMEKQIVFGSGLETSLQGLIP